MKTALAERMRHRMQLLREYRFAWHLALALLVIHGAVMLLGAEPRMQVYQGFGLSRHGFLDGNLWQLLSHGFLHGAWWHVLMNALALWWLSALLAHWISPKACFAVTLAGIAGGGAAHLLLGANGGHILIGISGGLFAVFACAATLSPDSRAKRVPLSMGMFALLVVVGEGVLSLSNPLLGIPGLSQLGTALNERLPVSHACHFGGGIAGWLCGIYLLRPRVTLETLRREREKKENGKS